jgi:hypothetical protein
MSPASLLTYSLLLDETKRREFLPKKPKTKAPVSPKQGATMKCASPKAPLPALSPRRS